MNNFSSITIFKQKEEVSNKITINKINTPQLTNNKTIDDKIFQTFQPENLKEKSPSKKSRKVFKLKFMKKEPSSPINFYSAEKPRIIEKSMTEVSVL